VDATCISCESPDSQIFFDFFFGKIPTSIACARGFRTALRLIVVKRSVKFISIPQRQQTA